MYSVVHAKPLVSETTLYAGIAQLAVHLICNQYVEGSSPFISSRGAYSLLGYRLGKSVWSIGKYGVETLKDNMGVKPKGCYISVTHSQFRENFCRRVARLTRTCYFG